MNMKKKYQDMTTKELREATREFDVESVDPPGRPLNARERALWSKAQKKAPRGRPIKGNGSLTISLSMERDLLKETDIARAKAKKSRAEVVAAALRSYLPRLRKTA